MLTGGASVIGWLVARNKIDGMDRRDWARLNVLEA